MVTNEWLICWNWDNLMILYKNYYCTWSALFTQLDKSVCWWHAVWDDFLMDKSFLWEGRVGDKSILLAASSVLTEISVTSWLIVCINLLLYLQCSPLNFSSVGKEPFMASKAKNATGPHFPGGRGLWSDGHDPALTWKFRSQVPWNVIPSFQDLFHPNQPLLFLDNNLKHLIPIILLCLQCSLFNMRGPWKEKLCIL